MRYSAMLLFALAMTACGDDDAGGATGRCEIVGAPISLPVSQDFAVAAASDSFQIVVRDETGVGAWSVTDDAVSERTDTGAPNLPLGRPKMTEVDGDVFLAVMPGNWGPTFVARTFRYDGAGWTPQASTSLTTTTVVSAFHSDLAVSSSNETALVWTDGVSTQSLAYAIFDSTATSVTPGSRPEPAQGGSVHALYAGDTLHVATIEREDGAWTLAHSARSATEEWSPVTQLGPAPGSLANNHVIDLALAGDDTLWAFEGHGAEIGDMGARIAGATTAFRSTDNGVTWTRAGAVSDQRFVTDHVSAAGLDVGAVVAVEYGDNNFDVAQSDDSVDLHLCDASGCERAVRVSNASGHFYGPIAVAARGRDGVVVFASEAKLGGPEALTAQRFRCD